MNRNTAIGIFRSSAIVAAASRVLETAERAAQTSATRSAWCAIADAWRRFDRSIRLRSIGTALMSAVIVHIALLALGPRPGWRAFVVPGIAFVQGVLLIVLSSSPRRNQ